MDVEDEMAETIGDRLAAMKFDAPQEVVMMPEHDVGSVINRLVAESDLVIHELRRIA